jgi:peptide/nickel transport system substrate-binding protein
MARSTRLLFALVAVAILAAAGIARWRVQAPARVDAPARGGAIVSSIRGEPRTFNRLVGRDATSDIVSQLLHARLVRVNRATQEIEPWLAERWELSPDGRTCTLHLRRGVRFSDGAPFTASDVVFSFRAIYDEKTGSALGESMRVGGKPLAVEAVDDGTVRVSFPSAFGPGVRLLDNVPILPRHKLEGALAQGTLAAAWRVDTPPAEISGLGPFVLQEYQPGHRLVFARNPRYFRTDAQGAALPYLDRVTLEIVPDQNAELLRLQAGQIDFTQSEVRAEDYATLRRAERAGQIRLVDMGVALDADSFWINLRPGLRIPDAKKVWLQSADLRRAISHAVDRRAFANTVFFGAAEPIWGPITPGNRTWHAPDLPRQAFDPAAARALVSKLGLTDGDGDGVLEDRSRAPVQFTLLTQKGNTALERGAAVLRDSLAKVGIRMDVAALEVGALVERLERGDYEAIYFRFLWTDFDPALHLDFWLSSGGAHVWNPKQAQPATLWEQRIDALMLKQAAALDQAERKRVFDEVQRILADELPILYFVAPRAYVATSTRVVNVAPSLIRPVILWNADSLAVRKVGTE